MSLAAFPLQLFDPTSSSYTYLLWDPGTGAAVLIDPVDQQIDRDLAVVARMGLKLVLTLETHVHADHLTSADRLRRRAGSRTAAPSGCGIRTAQHQLDHGDVLRFGAEELTALHTPGHTAGSMCYLWRHHVFTGDTLLIDGCGRTDLQSGSPEALYLSLHDVLFALPPDTCVWPGHDYRGRAWTTIGTERRTNARIAGKSPEQFGKTMRGLDLPPPRRYREAVPANLRSGVPDQDAERL
jgi:glyoxylase-like metal-dependent hydrolase (beta-lactamase superfamily II)